jgi:hypothetical protein
LWHKSEGIAEMARQSVATLLQRAFPGVSVFFFDVLVLIKQDPGSQAVKINLFQDFMVVSLCIHEQQINPVNIMF